MLLVLRESSAFYVFHYHQMRCSYYKCSYFHAQQTECLCTFLTKSLVSFLKIIYFLMVNEAQEKIHLKYFMKF